MKNLQKKNQQITYIYIIFAAKKSMQRQKLGN